MNDDILNEFIDKILAESKIDLNNLFYHTSGYSHNEDLLCSFFGFLISKCIVRFNPNSSTLSTYKFSKPGHVVMTDKIKRIAFIEEFKKFYDN